MTRTDDLDAPDMDLEMLSMLHGFRPQVVSHIVQTFLRDAARQIATIHRSLDEGAAETLHTTAHSLKGSSGTIGAKRLSALCAVLEREAKGDDWTHAHRAAQHLDDAFGKAREQLEQAMARWQIDLEAVPSEAP